MDNGENNYMNPIPKKELWKAYLWVLSFLQPYRWQTFWLIVFGLIIAASEMVIPKSIQYFIDQVLPSKDFNLFMYMMALIGLTVLLMIFAMAMKNLFQRIIGEKAARDLQFSVFQKLRVLGFAYYEQNSTGEILSILNTNVNDVQKIYRNYFPGVLIHSMTFLLSAIMIVNMNLLLSLVVVPCFLLYYTIGPWAERNAFVYSQKFADNRKDLEKSIYENMSSMQETRAFGMEEWNLAHFKAQFKILNRNWLTHVFFAHVRGSIRRLSLYLAVLVLFIYGSILLKENVLTLGEFIAFYFYFFIVMYSLTIIITLFTEQQTLMIQARNLHHFDQQKPAVIESEQTITLEAVKGDIRFKDVHFGYPNLPQVIQGLDLDIRAGENVAIVGESGCGKSTLLKLIGRFYDTDAGDIFIDGVSIKEFPLAQFRDSVGFVFQETYLFGTSIRENIRFGNPDATDEEVEEAAKKAFADEFIADLPDDYDTLVGERGYKLSGGQKQRIAIARMFIKSPSIVLLDEATSALDNISEYKVQQALEKLGKDRTTITIAHRLSTVQNCDRIYVMDHGRIVEQGRYDELLRKGGLFTELVNGKMDGRLVAHE
jgi:ATP-binding cassette subfamily B protein